MSDNVYTAYYWAASKPFDGRMFSIYRLLEHGGKPYRSSGSWKELGEASGFAVPKVQFPSGLCLAQTSAITMQLGEECGLRPPDWIHEAKAMQLTLDAAVMFAQKKGAKNSPEYKEKWLTYLQGVLETAGQGYFVGSSLSYADFAVLFPITAIGGRPVLGPYQLLATWFDMMEQLEGARAVDALGLAIMPKPKNICKFFCGCLRKRESPGSVESRSVETVGSNDFPAKEQLTYTVYYPDASAKFLGKSYAPLLLLEHTAAKHECDVPENAPPGWFAPPIVRSSSGACISQTPAIMIMLGTELGLAPKDPGDAAKAWQLAMDADDLFSEASKPPKRILKWYSYLEAVLESAGGGYFSKSGLTYVDFAMLMSLEVLSARVKLETPKLTTWMEMMANLPAVTTVKGKGVPLLEAQTGPPPKDSV